MVDAVLTTNLSLPNKRTGKVRDLYDLTLNDGSDGLLIVASDRVSAFDVVLENGIPGKGIMLTQISKFWFDFFGDRIRHHLISTDVADIEGISEGQRRSLEGRVMICKKTRVVPVECIVRGYLTGSGWKDYQKTGQVCGIELPAGMVNSGKIAEPIFTPSSKAEEGHDENISFEESCEIAGSELMEKVRGIALTIYGEARDYAATRGIILADTKFEFGLMDDDEPVLIDEIFTPDSSRFWPADDYQAGREQNSFDKQYIRNYLEELVTAGSWNKQAPGPLLPENIISSSYARYREAYERLTA